MRRRGLLLAAAAALVGAKPPSCELLALLRDPPGGIALGRAYLAGLEPVSAAALARSVRAGLSGNGRLRAQVAALIRADFGASRVVCLEGWIVSVTEARICAIAALSA